MREYLFTALLVVLAACASSPDVPSGADAIDSDAAWLVVEDMQGGQHDLGGVLDEGREVILVFWQTWCATCISEAPEVAAAARERAGQTLFVGVISGPDGVVDDEQVRELSARLGLPRPQVRDRDGSLARRFDVTGTPTFVVIAPEGRVTYRGHELPGAALPE